MQVRVNFSTFPQEHLRDECVIIKIFILTPKNKSAVNAAGARTEKQTISRPLPLLTVANETNS